ncbi:hypothetical protein [Ensifer canadensis]
MTEADTSDFFDRQARQDLSSALSRLSGRRVAKIEVEGPLLRSKLAWKIAVYQQALLYRIVSLGAGAVRACEAEDILVGILAARAVIESVSVFQDVVSKIERYLQLEALDEIDNIVMSRMFSTRDREAVEDNPKFKSVNVLTSVEALDRVIPGVLQHYRLLSERCHPNSMGHHQFFATTDKKTGAVTFSVGKRTQSERESAMAGVMLVALVEPLMDRLDSLIMLTAELQHRVSPVKDAR